MAMEKKRDEVIFHLHHSRAFFAGIKGFILPLLFSAKSDEALFLGICGNAFQNLTIKHIQLHGLTVEEYKKLCGYGPGQKLISRNLLAKLQENVQKAQNARHRSQQEPDEEQPA